MMQRATAKYTLPHQISSPIISIAIVTIRSFKDDAAAGLILDAPPDQTLVGIRERIGVMPAAEDSEEVRLELLRLTKAVLLAVPSSAPEHIDHVAAILEKSCYDKFPDAKKLAAELIVWLSAQKEVGLPTFKTNFDDFGVQAFRSTPGCEGLRCSLQPTNLELEGSARPALPCDPEAVLCVCTHPCAFGLVHLCVRVFDVQAQCLNEYCAPLSKALLLNFTHQQQKTRVAALQAVGAIVPINPSILKEALPSVAKLNLDRSHQLREQVCILSIEIRVSGLGAQGLVWSRLQPVVWICVDWWCLRCMPFARS